MNSIKKISAILLGSTLALSAFAITTNQSNIYFKSLVQSGIAKNVLEACQNMANQQVKNKLILEPSLSKSSINQQKEQLLQACVYDIENKTPSTTGTTMMLSTSNTQSTDASAPKVPTFSELNKALKPGANSQNQTNKNIY